METAAPLNTGLLESEETLKSRGGNQVTDDRMLYDELVVPLQARMMRSIWRVVRNADLAEDCLQDALAVVWKKRLQIRIHPNPQALILSICLNAAYDALRRLERIRRQTDVSRQAHAFAPAAHAADRDLEEREIEEQVQQAIRRLPRKRALAVMMRLVHEESFEAIALALGCSEITARIHISGAVPSSGNGSLRFLRVAGRRLEMNKMDTSEADLDNHLKRTLKDDLPPEAETRMRQHFLSLKYSLDGTERSPEPDGWLWVRGPFRKEILAVASAVMIVLGVVMQVDGSQTALAHSIEQLKVIVSISVALNRASSMDCTILKPSEEDERTSYHVRWRATGDVRVDMD